MNILHVSAPLSGSVLLSAHAANVESLPDALRARGHRVTSWTADDPYAAAASIRPGQFDIVHVHAAGPDMSEREYAVPALATRYDPETGRRDLPWVALSYAQVRALDEQPAAVIAPPIDVDALPLDARGDELVTVFDGADIYTLRSAIAVARHCERPLTIVIPEAATLTAEAEELLARAEPILRVVRAGMLWQAEDFGDVAAYLAFERRSFDMGALTAMAAGVPVVTFDGFPASELIVHGESGYVVRSLEDACWAIESLASLQPGLGRARARVLFTPESAAAQHEALYERLIAGDYPAFRHPETTAPDPAAAVAA